MKTFEIHPNRAAVFVPLRSVLNEHPLDVQHPKTPQIRSFFYEKWLLFGVLAGQLDKNPLASKLASDFVSIWPWYHHIKKKLWNAKMHVTVFCSHLFPTLALSTSGYGSKHLAYSQPVSTSSPSLFIFSLVLHSIISGHKCQLLPCINFSFFYFFYFRFHTINSS